MLQQRGNKINTRSDKKKGNNNVGSILVGDDFIARIWEEEHIVIITDEPESRIQLNNKTVYKEGMLLLKFI